MICATGEEVLERKLWRNFSTQSKLLSVDKT